MTEAWCSRRTPAEAAVEAAAVAAAAKPAKPRGRPRKLIAIPAARSASPSASKDPSWQGPVGDHAPRPRGRPRRGTTTPTPSPPPSPSSSDDLAAELAPGMLLNPKAIAATSQNSPPAAAAAAAAATAFPLATPSTCAAVAAAKQESILGDCPVPIWLEQMLPYHHHACSLSIASSSDPSECNEQSLCWLFHTSICQASLVSI